MTSYPDLIAAKGTVGSIKRWVNNNTVDSATIVTEAEAWIYSRLRDRRMLTSTSGTLGTAVDTLALPARFKQWKHFMFEASGTTAKSIPVRKTLEFVLDRFSYQGDGSRETGLPLYWATDAENMQFEKKNDKARPFRLTYYQALASLSTATGGTTNFLTEDYPTLLRKVCMGFANEFLKDEREKVYWLKLAEAEINEANVESDEDLVAADIQMIVGGYPDGYGDY